MSEFDSIGHLDFPVPPELAAAGEAARFESLEVDRVKLLYAFFDHLQRLDAEHGPIDPKDPEQYVKRLRALESLMAQEMESFSLQEGDLVQASVPNIVYPAGFAAEFDGGEAVRARFDGLAIYPHYDVAPDGAIAERLPFGLNLSISEAMTVTPEGLSSIEGMGEMNPLLSLHHDTADLQRVVLWD